MPWFPVQVWMALVQVWSALVWVWKIEIADCYHYEANFRRTRPY